MAPPPQPEARRFPRIRSEHPVRAVLVGRGPREEFGTTRIIGLGGCSFFSRRPFGAGALLELQIPLDGGVVAADARVVYELAENDGHVEVGVEFLRIPARHVERIKALLKTAAG